MAEMMKALIEQNKAMMEMMKDQSEKKGNPGPSNLAKRPAETQQKKFKNKSYQVQNGSYIKVSRLGWPQWL